MVERRITKVMVIIKRIIHFVVVGIISLRIVVVGQIIGRIRLEFRKRRRLPNFGLLPKIISIHL